MEDSANMSQPSQHMVSRAKLPNVLHRTTRLGRPEKTRQSRPAKLDIFRYIALRLVARSEECGVGEWANDKRKSSLINGVGAAVKPFWRATWVVYMLLGLDLDAWYVVPCTGTKRASCTPLNIEAQALDEPEYCTFSEPDTPK
jgi:hypothetical protein